MGAEGISSDTRDRRRKGLRIASSAPPALSLSRVQNSRNSLPCPLMPRTKTGMARESRAQQRRSGVGWVVADSPRPQRIRNHSRTEDGPADRVTTHDTMVRVGKKRRCGVFASKETHADRSPNGILRDVREIPGLPLFPAVVRKLVGWKYFVKPTHKTPA